MVSPGRSRRHWRGSSTHSSSLPMLARGPIPLSTHGQARGEEGSSDVAGGAGVGGVGASVMSCRSGYGRVHDFGCGCGFGCCWCGVYGKDLLADSESH